MNERRIPIAEPSISAEELELVSAAVKSGWISSQGEFIHQFEEGFAAYCGAQHGVSTSNGTTALHLAIEVLGITAGDEVIVPALTFVATANAVAYTGAKPVLVDVHPGYWCINPAGIEEKITSKTKAIIVVHLYGHPADMDAISDIAKKYGLYVIEDAAEAHGAEYRGRKVGSIGDIGIFSFYGNKIITTGEGGMLLCNNDSLATKATMLKNHGMDPTRKYWHPVVGFNYRMTNIQAALGVAQLQKIDGFIEKKRALRQRYQKLLGSVNVVFQQEMPWAHSSWWMTSVVFDSDVSRERIARLLQEQGVETRPLFYPLHHLPPYRSGESYPVAEELSRRGLSLPSGVALSTDEIEYIGNLFHQFQKSVG